MSAAPEEHHRAVRGARLRPERGGWALPGLLALGLHVAMLMVPLTRPAAREHRALAPVAVRLQPAPRPT
ncbi:MAG: hypothetical protein KC933_17650, partial [Myxococcales bacterium]|nr:hypothetical protein [Myxococcales bacterium]